MSLLNLTPAEFCSATNACADSREWALTQPTMSDVWDNCPRSDWLLWIANKVSNRPSDRTLRLFAVWCARNTPLGDGRVTGDLLTDPTWLAALEVADRYANWKASREELDAAWDAAGADARNSARAAALAAVRDAGWTVWAARDAALAARDGWRDAARAAQANYLRTLVPNPFRKEAQP